MMSNNKKQRSMILSVVLMTSLIFILLLGGWHLAESGFKDIVPIENVEIESTYENVSLNDLREKVVSVLEGGYFSVDLEIIRSALLEMPWVEDASIRRHWPSGLHIKVIEKQAIAYWSDGAFLSNRGEIFTPLPMKHDKLLPKLSGPEGSHNKVLGFLMKISDDFNEMGVEVKKLTLDERRAWSLTIANAEIKDDVEVKFGREDTDNRLDRFVRVFSKNAALDMNTLAVIDMRYPNGFAVRKKNKDEKISVFNKAVLTREV